MRHIPVYPTVCLALLLASGCCLFPAPPAGHAPPQPTPTPLPSPTPSTTPAPYPTSGPSATPEPPDTGWQSLQPGVEVRQVRLEAGAGVERLAMVRLEPAVVRFRVHYNPLAPQTVSAWAAELQPLLVVNGGYFTPENETTGLLVSEGRAWGTPYGDFGGMFAVGLLEDGQEQVSVRWLRRQPYDPAEPLREALQSFPVLVKPGGVMGFPAEADGGRPARRSVVAQDVQGRILVIVAPRGHLSLHELARFLVEADLELDVALNLDGGFSTGLWLGMGENVLEIESLVPVPSVISVDYR